MRVSKKKLIGSPKSKKEVILEWRQAIVEIDKKLAYALRSKDMYTIKNTIREVRIML